MSIMRIRARWLEWKLRRRALKHMRKKQGDRRWSDRKIENFWSSTEFKGRLQ